MQNKYSNITLLLLAIILLSSCVEEYWPELELSDGQTLIVDGNMNNLPGPYKVLLSKSLSMEADTSEPIIGASVKILDNQGAIQHLTEVSPGDYQTTDPNFIGVIGNSYKIEITLADGTEYATEYEELVAPVPIEEVSYEEHTKVIDETSGEAETGFLFNISTAEGSSTKNFFFWQLEETYEDHAEFKILWYYDGNRNFETDGPLFSTRSTEEQKNIQKCWNTRNIYEYFTGSTNLITSPTLNKAPLHFIEYQDDRVKIGYSLVVKQHVINERAYLFLKGLEDQNSNQSDFYTSQPYKIVGNISNITDPKNPALGYFLVSGLSISERIFTRKPSHAFQNKYGIKCGTPIVNRCMDPALTLFIVNSVPSMWPLYFTNVTIPNDAVVGCEVRPGTVTVPAYLNIECFDCRLKGGVTTKPDFWINNIEYNR